MKKTIKQRPRIFNARGFYFSAIASPVNSSQLHTIPYNPAQFRLIPWNSRTRNRIPIGNPSCNNLNSKLTKNLMANFQSQVSVQRAD